MGDASCMSVHEHVTHYAAAGPAATRTAKLKKLRLLLILAGVAFLALVSTVFGMMMAVAADLPALENLPQFAQAENSVLWTTAAGRLGDADLQRGPRDRPLPDEISLSMQHAIIAIEDRRFYENSGVDLRGIGRAFVQDLVKGRPPRAARRSPSSS